MPNSVGLLSKLKVVVLDSTPPSFARARISPILVTSTVRHIFSLEKDSSLFDYIVLANFITPVVVLTYSFIGSCVEFSSLVGSYVW